MKKFWLVIKILIAILLVSAIAYFGYNYYATQYSLKLQERENLEAEADRLRIAEENKITYEDVDEDKMNLFKEYLPKVFVDFQESKPLPPFDNIRNVDKNYITLVAYNGAIDNIEPKLKNENGEKVFSYDEINSYIVSLFGKNGHNLFDRVTDVSGYFYKTNDGYLFMGMGGSETLSYRYIIDSLKKGSDGKYHGFIYEYLVFTPEGPVLDVEQSGAKEYLANTKQSSEELYDGKLLKDNIIKEYTFEITKEGNDYISRLKDGDNYVEGEYLSEYEKQAEMNKDKLVEKELVLDYDEALNCFYLEAVKIVNE